MTHFSCDICGRDMTHAGADRYVLKMEAFAAANTGALTDDDLETDPVEEMALLLREQGEDLPEPLPLCKKMRFDLCPACFRKFVDDPLGRDSAAKFQFSPN
ncbi:MAG: hypothetical protein K2V38_08160 [Gemmataceae bacterium]|nr:hypothetical protein [Gemmataceae bacterium]